LIISINVTNLANCKKETDVRAEKGQIKKSEPGMAQDRKENPISGLSIHVAALVSASSL
jgi:hypothetical protein